VALLSTPPAPKTPFKVPSRLTILTRPPFLFAGALEPRRPRCRQWARTGVDKSGNRCRPGALEGPAETEDRIRPRARARGSPRAQPLARQDGQGKTRGPFIVGPVVAPREFSDNIHNIPRAII
jgi:hypothetical protein